MTDGIIEGKKINVGAILSGMAFLLVVSICIALYLGANEEIEERPPAAGEVTISEMDDYLHKLTHLVGPRDLTTSSGQDALRSVAAMIDGTLGSSNTGFKIFKKVDPAVDLLWQTLWIEAGNQDAKKVVMVSIPYGNEGHEVAFALGFGEYLTKHRPNYKLKLVFYPPLPEVNRAWLVERTISKRETLAGSISIKFSKAAPRWATLSLLGQEDRALRNDTIFRDLSHRQWLENLTPLTSPTQEHDAEFTLHLDPTSPRDGTPARFLRMLPVVKLVADVFPNF